MTTSAAPGSPTGNTYGHPKGACPRGVAECTGCNPNSGPAAEADVDDLRLGATASIDHDIHDGFHEDEEDDEPDVVPADVQVGDILLLDSGEEVEVLAARHREEGGYEFEFSNDPDPVIYEYETYFATRIGHVPPDAQMADAAREEAETGLHIYEGWLRRGTPSAGRAHLIRAASELEASLGDDPRRRVVEAARTKVEAALAAGGDLRAAPVEGERILHATIVDSLSSAPTREEIENLRAHATGAYDAVVTAAVARSTGEGNGDGLARAREFHAAAQEAVQAAEDSRHTAARERVAQGRPTLFDVQEAETRKSEAFYARRKAVNEADTARGVYATTEPDNPEFDRRRLAADEATRREAEAQEALRRAERELSEASRAWDGLNAPPPLPGS